MTNILQEVVLPFVSQLQDHRLGERHTQQYNSQCDQYHENVVIAQERNNPWNVKSVSIIGVLVTSLTLQANSEAYASHCEENSLYLAMCSSSRPRRGRLYLSSLNAAFRSPN